MSGAGGVLALDLSGFAGWAYGCKGDAAPRCGVWVLPKFVLDAGRHFAAFENELADAIAEFQPAVVSMEAPLPANFQTHALSAEQQIGLAALAATTCYRWERPLYRRAVQTVRSAVLNNGRLRKDEAKQVVTAWCRARGWAVPDHNAADACVVWAFEVGIRAPRLKPARVPPVLDRAATPA